MKKNYQVLFNVILSFFLYVVTSSVCADPPSQVIRLGYIDGTVTFSPAGIDQWVNATTNRPIVTGDKLWTDAGSKDELQFGSAVLRMNEYTSISVLNNANNSPQIELDQGNINLHIWKMSYYKSFEIDTPNLAFSVNQPGDYRIGVNPSDNTTTITVREGTAVVYGENNSYQINAGQSFRFSGTQLNYVVLTPSELDTFEQWCASRNVLHEQSISKRYVSPMVIGSTDLDNNGQWVADANYGTIWYPSAENSGWAPYSQGQWVWIEPWGWTWEDDQPWGFAPFHYGRWFYGNRGWGWVPGPIDVEPVYAPALVAFYLNSFNRSSGGAIGWFPLGPGDVYVPSYNYSRNYFSSINVSNAYINQTVINNFYNNPNQSWAYRNLNAPHAVTAVSTKAFVASKPTVKAAIALPKSALTNVHPSHIAAVAPINASVIGNTKIASARPSAKVLAMPIIAKTKPPAAPIPFASKQGLLVKNPGKPLAPSSLSALSVASKPSASVVNVVHGHSTPVSIVTPKNGALIKGTIKTIPTKSMTPHPIITAPQVIHKPSTPGESAKPLVINPKTPIVNPHPAVVNPHPTVVNPHPTVVNPHPVVVSPHPVVVNPHPTEVTPHPAVVHPHPAVVNPHPVVVHPHPAVVNPHPVVVHPHPAVVNPHPVVVHPHPAVVNPHPVIVHPHPEAHPGEKH